MTPLDLYESMRKALDEKMEVLIGQVASGLAKDYPEYRFLVGQIRATKADAVLLSETYQKMFETRRIVPEGSKL
jgi:hypothetical protein